MQISETSSAVPTGQAEGFEFTHLGDHTKAFPGFAAKENTDRFFQWGIKIGQDLNLAKYRFN